MANFIGPLTGFHSSQWHTVVGPFRPTSDKLRSSYTQLAKIPINSIKVIGNKVRLTLIGTVEKGHTGTINNVTIGPSLTNATSGKAWDGSATPTAITFQGSPSLTVSRYSVHVSDEIEFSIDGTKPIIIGFNMAASSYVSLASSVGGQKCIGYWRAGVQEADDATRSTGYTAVSGEAAFIHTLEVYS